MQESGHFVFGKAASGVVFERPLPNLSMCRLEQIGGLGFLDRSHKDLELEIQGDSLLILRGLFHRSSPLQRDQAPGKGGHDVSSGDR